MTKQQLINEINNLAAEMKISFIEACSAMQGAAAKMGDEKMITVIHKIKMESIKNA
jgi:hypothetical protein